MIWKRSRSHTCSFISARKVENSAWSSAEHVEWNIFSSTEWEEADTILQWLSGWVCARRKIVAKTESENVFAISVSNVAFTCHTLHVASPFGTQLSQLCRRFGLVFIEWSLLVFRFSHFSFFLFFFSFSFSFYARVRVAIYICSLQCFFSPLLCSFIFLSFTRSPGGIIKTFRCYFSCHADFQAIAVVVVADVAAIWCMHQRLLFCRYFVRCSGIWFEK